MSTIRTLATPVTTVYFFLGRPPTTHPHDLAHHCLSGHYVPTHSRISKEPAANPNMSRCTVGLAAREGIGTYNTMSVPGSAVATHRVVCRSQPCVPMPRTSSLGSAGQSSPNPTTVQLVAFLGRLYACAASERMHRYRVVRRARAVTRVASSQCFHM